MKKFIATIACDSQSGSHGVIDRHRTTTSLVDVGYTHSEQALILSKLREWKKGEDLYFWKRYPKDINFLELKPEECTPELIGNGSLAHRLKNIPYTHFYYMTNNVLKITDGYNSQVLVVKPYDENIYAVITDIDTLVSEFVNKETYELLKENADNLIKMYFESEGLTKDISGYSKDSGFRIPNEVIDYNKFNYDTGMVRGDSYDFPAKDNFLHIDLVVN